MTSDKKGIALLTEIFVKKGLKQIVISPGSRNAPIIISFAQNPKIKALSIVDERSAAFFALGMTQKTKQTVAIACTSGTATLNYAPAIAEAYYQKVPLLVLTADRPEELIDQGDGQTIRQKNIYANYIKKSFELPQEISNKADSNFAETNQADYIKQAKKFIDSFNTSFKKAILSRIHFAEKKDFDAGKFFINLQKSYPPAFCHLINIPGVGMWVGASPEMLISIDPKTVQTVSLAGTQQNNGRNRLVVWQEKEIEEQQIVSDYIESLLKKFRINSYVKEETQTVEAGNTLHLATRYRFKTSELKNKTGDFIEELHPTPAVCGVPKEKALDIIFNTENHNREYYTGFLGTVNINSQTELFVNLRCMKILSNKLALYAGGGLTKKSIPERRMGRNCIKGAYAF